MSNMKRSMWIILGIALLLAVAVAATAIAAGQDRAQRERPERGPGMLHRVVMGEVVSVSGDTMKIKPEIPQELLDRLADFGVENPKLPDSISLTFSDDSKLMLAGKPVELDVFKKGDKVIAFCEESEDPTDRIVLRLTDEESARKLMEGRREFMGRGESDMPPGGPGQMGPGAFGANMGPGGRQNMMERNGKGEFRERMRPVFGEITKLTDSEISIRVEIPDFIVERMTESGREFPEDIPTDVTLKYGDRTRFIVSNEPVDEIPFKVGDEIAAMGIKLDEVLAAVIISDLESAQERMEQGPGRPGAPDMEPSPEGDSNRTRQKNRNRR